MQIIDHCSLSNRVVDFLDQLANDILDKKRMTADNLSLFLPKRQVSAEEKVKGFLVIFNSCAKKFSKHDSLK